jgi:hypothetical protein
MNEKVAKIAKDEINNYVCDCCHYICYKKSDYTKHLNTTKHKKKINLNTNEQKTLIPILFICKICNKSYKGRNGLWYHEQKCGINKSENTKSENTKIENTKIENTIVDSSSNEIKILTNLVIELVKSNNELQKQMIDVCQKIQPTVINNTNTNSNNKTFNLQVFLNEECKDAMNMSDFINSIELKISDLVNIGKLGYVEGVSNIIIKQLNDTDINKRPVHCSDAKRETLYVKEENKWEKETQETKQMLTAVRGVNKKNYQMLHNWKETHPKCTDSKSTQCDDYMKIMSKVMDGDVENMNKVIKKVAKQVLIDK